MIIKPFISLLLCLAPIVSIAQLSLTVEITELRNNIGQVHLELSDENNALVAGITKNISNKKCIFVIENLKPGKYAYRFIHDENMNNKIDTNWLGIPKEGFGFSNNPGMTFGPPSFEKTLFELHESKVMKSKPKYY